MPDGHDPVSLRIAERVALRLGRSAGVYFLQVATPTRKTVVKVVKR